MSYTKKEKKIRTTHKVRQLGSVWLWTMARRIEVRDILQFADDLREADAPLKQPVEFETDQVHQTAMSVKWTTEDDG